MVNTAAQPVALITGAARRIGACTAEHLHGLGYRIVIHYSTSEAAAVELQSKLNSKRENSASLVQGDLLDNTNYQRIVDEAVAAYNRLDLLVNNASSFYPTLVGDISLQDWDDLMGSNLKAPLFISQAAVPVLKKHQGNIVNIVDIHAKQPMGQHPVYCAAKAGLQMLTLSLAKELGPDIRVNGVAPGAIIWPENSAEIGDETKEEILSRTALKKVGDPKYIAEAIAYLAQAEYVTGQIIAVDGGRSLGW